MLTPVNTNYNLDHIREGEGEREKGSLPATPAMPEHTQNPLGLGPVECVRD